MKTTLEVPDELMRALKVRAAEEGRTFKSLITELLTTALDSDASRRPIRHRVTLPLIDGTHPAARDAEVTPERIKDLLLEADIERAEHTG